MELSPIISILFLPFLCFLLSNLFRIWSKKNITKNDIVAPHNIINLDSQFLNINHAQKYPINVMVIIRYIQTLL